MSRTRPFTGCQALTRAITLTTFLILSICDRSNPYLQQKINSWPALPFARTLKTTRQTVSPLR